ncbi:MAG: hypothetical protein KME64_41200 [Scytonematopsis contorta HA4267-MV1]|jgi:hypothetical protein|nr:hypothetical protein [Scytonematopsis contorta HA4267-MV1]MBW4512863.1 hypothetical protein [Scytonematopsis contorta HA4267-MV1]
MGAPNEQNIAIISSSGNTISLTFTPGTTDVIKEIIIKLSEAYKTLVNTKIEEIQYDFRELNTLD